MDLDTALKDLGQFGRFQAYCFALLFLPVTLYSFKFNEYMFTTMDVTHRCRIPECESSFGPVEFSPAWLSSAIPLDSDQRPEPCLRYRYIEHYTVNNISVCPPTRFVVNVTETCDDWVFQETVTTIGTDFGIMCPEDYWRRTLLSSLPVLANILGLPVTGLLSDRFGRKNVVVVASVTISVLGLLESFSKSYTMLAALELLSGLSVAPIHNCALLLGLETLSPNKRLLGNMLICTFYMTGEIIVALDMWAFGNWRYMQRAMYTPMLALVFLYWLLPESVRWLHTQGRFDEVEEVFFEMAKRNKTQEKLSKVLSRLQPSKVDVSKRKTQPQDGVRSLSLTALLRSRVIMWRLLACSLCCSACMFTSVGITQVAVYFKGNRYVSFILVCLVELPAYIVSLWLPDWKTLGRRGCLVWSFVLAGVAFLATYFVPSDQVVLNLLLSLVAKLLASITVTVVYVYAAELFPTELRNSLISTCTMMGSLGMVVAQQIPLLERVVDPLLMFAGVSMVGGLLAMTCPETLGTSMPDTIQEAEHIRFEARRTSNLG